MKQQMIQIGFVHLLTTSVDLFSEFAFASILTPHEQWYERVFGLESEHQQGFNKVCQRILGDLLGMFEASLFAPKTTTKSKFFLARPSLPPGTQWFQVHRKNSRDAGGCAPNKRRIVGSGARPFSDDDEMGDGIHGNTVAEAKWTGPYDTSRIASRRTRCRK
jgi:hypothetical protein